MYKTLAQISGDCLHNIRLSFGEVTDITDTALQLVICPTQATKSISKDDLIKELESIPNFPDFTLYSYDNGIVCTTFQKID